jgi:hypothetical protein
MHMRILLIITTAISPLCEPHNVSLTNLWSIYKQYGQVIALNLNLTPKALVVVVPPLDFLKNYCIFSSFFWSWVEEKKKVELDWKLDPNINLKNKNKKIVENNPISNFMVSIGVNPTVLIFNLRWERISHR